MKLDSHFVTHDSGSEHYIVTTGGGDFNGLVKANDTAAFICSCLTEETTEEAIVEKILAEYDVDRAAAQEAVRTVVEKLRSIGAING